MECRKNPAWRCRWTMPDAKCCSASSRFSGRFDSRHMAHSMVSGFGRCGTTLGVILDDNHLFPLYLMGVWKLCLFAETLPNLQVRTNGAATSGRVVRIASFATALPILAVALLHRLFVVIKVHIWDWILFQFTCRALITACANCFEGAVTHQCAGGMPCHRS
jgi:hypothetical protein